MPVCNIVPLLPTRGKLSNFCYDVNLIIKRRTLYTLTNFELLEPGDDDARGSEKIKQLNTP